MSPYQRFGALAAAALVSAAFSGAGCAGPSRSSRLTGGDLGDVVRRMRHSLGKSDFLAGRNRESEPAVITVNRVENLTSDVINSTEQWMAIARLIGSLPIGSLGRSKQIIFQVAPEKYAMLRAYGYKADPNKVKPPTHLMQATYRSARRGGRNVQTGVTDRRADYYYLEYRITHVRTRKLVWSDSFSVKREALGLAID